MDGMWNGELVRFSIYKCGVADVSPWYIAGFLEDEPSSIDEFLMYMILAADNAHQYAPPQEGWKTNLFGETPSPTLTLTLTLTYRPEPPGVEVAVSLRIFEEAGTGFWLSVLDRLRQLRTEQRQQQERGDDDDDDDEEEEEEDSSSDTAASQRAWDVGDERVMYSINWLVRSVCRAEADSMSGRDFEQLTCGDLMPAVHPSLAAAFLDLEERFAGSAKMTESSSSSQREPTSLQKRCATGSSPDPRPSD